MIAVVQTLHLQRLCPIDAGQIYDGKGRVIDNDPNVEGLEKVVS